MLKNTNKMNKQATIWEVFIQSKNGLAHKHAGNVHAEDKEMALQNARDLYTRRNEGSCIWVVKSEHIVSSVPEDAESFFDPANDKVYRHPTFYKMPDGAKHI
jgi:ring-1,2-phenylacetyl-CoA epoxidase subunit PaaB